MTCKKDPSSILPQPTTTDTTTHDLTRPWPSRTKILRGHLLTVRLPRNVRGSLYYLFGRSVTSAAVRGRFRDHGACHNPVALIQLHLHNYWLRQDAETGFWRVARRGIGAKRPSVPLLDMQVQCPVVGRTAAAAGMPVTRPMTLAKMQY